MSANLDAIKDESVIALMRRIQRGDLDPQNLAIESRQSCVAHLTIEGYSTPEISEILKVSDRTIIRDRREIRRSNAVQEDPKLVGEIVGQLVSHAEYSIAQIRRTIRDKAVTPRDRIEGVRTSWQIMDQYVARLQSLGYLPSTAMKVHSEIIHHLGTLPGGVEIQDELARIEAIVQTSCETGEADQRESTLAAISKLKNEASKLALVEQVDELKQTLANEKGESDGKPD